LGVDPRVPTAVTNLDGRFEIFMIDDSGSVFHVWQNAPNNGWSDWDMLPDDSSLWVASALGRGFVES